nr:DHHA1 domain-containing protein [uncultured Romboutsia sp.]
MEKLYYIDQYIKEFTAEIIEVLEINNQFHVLLDKTAFFPGGGGQFCDLGKIDIHPVIDVYEKENKVYHVLEKRPIKIHKVKCEIDWNRREDGMHQHFAQHVLSGCFYNLFKLNTVSFHLGKESSTVDIQGILTEDQIRKVEQFANEMISNDIKLEVLTPSKKDLKKIWIRRDLPDTSAQIRIVKIGDLDSNACCGVHPRSTLDLRLIKIKKWEKNRGNTRVEFFAGKRAINYILKRDLILNDICRNLKCGEEEVIKGIVNINNKVQEVLSENKKLEAIVSDYEIKDMIDKSTQINNISIIKNIYTDKSIKYISKVVSKITENDNFIVLLAVINDDKANLVYASSKNLKVKVNDLLKDSIKLIDGNGGGTPFMAQGGGKNNGNIENTLNYALSKLEKFIG